MDELWLFRFGFIVVLFATPVKRFVDDGDREWNTPVVGKLAAGLAPRACTR
jgi:hypothetical protein